MSFNFLDTGTSAQSFSYIGSLFNQDDPWKGWFAWLSPARCRSKPWRGSEFWVRAGLKSSGKNPRRVHRCEQTQVH